MSERRVTNALSFDVEDWYQVTAFAHVLARSSWNQLEHRLSNALRRILRLLAEYHAKSTFFVLADNLETHPEIVDGIAQDGHELASHGTGHQLIYQQSREEFRQDLETSLERIRHRTKVEVKGFRAPSFSITRKSLWALDVLLDCGLTYDSSIVPISRGLYGIPDADPYPGKIETPSGRSILEFPITSRRLLGRSLPFCGGAYFRLCPLFLMKRWIKEVNQAGYPAIVYLHPWELDPDHPVLPRQRYRSLHYVNLRSTEGKLRSLLEHFSFGSVSEVLAQHVR